MGWRGGGRCELNFALRFQLSEAELTGRARFALDRGRRLRVQRRRGEGGELRRGHRRRHAEAAAAAAGRRRRGGGARRRAAPQTRCARRASLAVLDPALAVEQVARCSGCRRTGRASSGQLLQRALGADGRVARRLRRRVRLRLQVGQLARRFAAAASVERTQAAGGRTLQRLQRGGSGTCHAARLWHGDDRGGAGAAVGRRRHGRPQCTGRLSEGPLRVHAAVDALLIHRGRRVEAGGIRLSVGAGRAGWTGRLGLRVGWRRLRIVRGGRGCRSCS